MLDEIEDLIYQWRHGFITREQAEERILEVVLTYEAKTRERLAEEATAAASS